MYFISEEGNPVKLTGLRGWSCQALIFEIPQVESLPPREATESRRTGLKDLCVAVLWSWSHRSVDTEKPLNICFPQIPHFKMAVDFCSADFTGLAWLLWNIVIHINEILYVKMFWKWHTYKQWWNIIVIMDVWNHYFNCINGYASKQTLLWIKTLKWLFSFIFNWKNFKE